MRNRISDEQGFTLIELLVVILIIGILAAIALPNFLGQRSRGQDASAKSDARNLVSHIEACYTDSQDYSACNTKAALAGSATGSLGVEYGTGAGQVSVTASAANTFTITATSKSGNTFSIAKAADGTLTRSCTVGSGGNKGGCNGTSW